jgi:hypothetical protein
MSLILEALKKLEREKQAPERSVLVLGATAWATHGERRSRLAVVIGAATALLAAGVAAALFWPRGAPRARPATPQAAAAAAPTPTPPVLPIVAPPAPDPLPSAPLRAAAAEAPARSRTPAAPAPRAMPTPGAAAFTLQAISERDGEPVALIDDHLLHVGEGFGGMRVLRITPTEVEIELEASGERRVLTF